MLKRINEVTIPEEGDPFTSDLLDRRTIANNLTTLLENTTTPYVISISAPWGQGKTTFIKMWKKLLEQQGFGTVYFDAWSTDYADDPLLAFINAIDSAVGEDNTPAQQAMGTVKTAFKNVIKASPKIALNWALRGGLQYITDNDQNAKDEIDAISNIAAELIDQEMAKFSATREMLDEFGKKLSELGETMGEEGKPLVIFVDELDRCRPDYAVELLERIKHLFAVENLLVVLSVDTQKLGHAASQVIGFSPEDTDGYLRRFIDLDYRLPEANIARFIQSHLSAYELSNNHAFHGMHDCIASLARLRKLSTRDCAMIIQRYTATAKTFPNLYYGYSHFLPIAILESYYDRDSLIRTLTNRSCANERLRELKEWRDDIQDNDYHDERHSRRNVFEIYAGWLVQFDNGVLEEEEKANLLNWSSRAFGHDRFTSRCVDLLFEMIDYARSIS